jgi:DNA-binding MarR family transcriptional regulator
MAVLEQTIENLSLAERRATLQRALDEQDESAAQAFARGYQDLALRAFRDRDLEAIASLRAQIARLTRRVAAGEHDGVATWVLGRFEGIADQLDRSEVLVLMEAGARGREEAAEPVRRRVLELLAEGPQRPRDLADKLGCDPSQISRALRELQEARAVERVDAAQLGGDRRAIWYAPAQKVRRAAAV